MEKFICVQCGTQFGENAEPPARCPICQDARQYVRHGGQKWITLAQLADGHQNKTDDIHFGGIKTLEGCGQKRR